MRDPLPWTSTEAVAREFERRREQHADFLLRVASPAWLTLGLVALILGLWGLEVASGTHHSVYGLVQKGARVGHLVRAGEFWRLITALGLHSSFDHAVSNALILLGIGWLAERFYGARRYFILLLSAGIGGGLLGAALEPRVSVGASGAIFGLWAADLVFAHRHWAYLPPRFRLQVGWTLGLVLFYYLCRGLLTIDPALRTDADHWAHLGGLVTGFVVALAMDGPGLHPPVNQNTPGMTLLLLMTVAACILAVVLEERSSRFPDLIAVRRLEGAFAPYQNSRMGFTLERPALWQLDAARLEPELRSAVSGVRMLVLSGETGSGTGDLEQSDPLHLLDATLRQAAEDATDGRDSTPITLERTSIGGLPARRMALSGLGPAARGRAVCYAVWSPRLRDVVVFMFISQSPLPAIYDGLFREVMDSVRWAS